VIARKENRAFAVGIRQQLIGSLEKITQMRPTLNISIMKRPVQLALLALFINGALFAQQMDGELKPKRVTTKPAPSEFFIVNKATKPVDRELPVVITQFNVTLPQDQEFYARTGNDRDRTDDAQVLLRFHISNLDKAKFQQATDQLAEYLKERLKAQGFKIGNYTDFSSGKKYEGIELKPSPKGGIPDLYGPGFTVPGEFKLAKKAIMFTAYEQPLYPAQSMKVGYISIEKKINLLTFGWVLNFMEFETNSSAKSDAYTTTKSLSVSFNEQLYGDPWIILMSPNLSSMWVTPNVADREKDATYGYTYGREFATKIDKETGDVEVDNEKFIAAYLELGKSLIDNMTDLMAKPAK